MAMMAVIRDRQADYYHALGEADAAADATPFVSFMLQALLAAMQETMTQTGSEKILACLRQTPDLSAREIAHKLAISPRAVEKHLAALQQAGRLHRVGAARGGYWEVL